MNEVALVGKYRRKYGECFLSIMENGLEIPWKRLSLGRFLYYRDLAERNIYSQAEIEDQIFAECCLSENIVAAMPDLKAGVISTVVEQISLASGPHSDSQIEQDLNVSRWKAVSFLKDAAGLICQILPSYKIHELLEMDYEDFMEVLAIAERRGLSTGVISQPLEIISEEAEQEPKPERKREVEFRDLNPQQSQAKPKPQPAKSTETQFITDEDVQESMIARTGHEAWDGDVHGLKEVEQMKVIYKDYLDMMARGEKITPETIKQHRGTTREQVAQHYEEYKKKVADGTIKPKTPNSPKPEKKQKKKKIVVKRLN